MPPQPGETLVSKPVRADESTRENRTAEIQPAIHEEPVIAERARSLYGRGLLPYLTNIINGTVLTIVLWGSGILPTVLISWLSALTVLTLIRIGVWRLFLARAPGLAQSRRWVTIYTVGTAVNGVTWGSAAFFLYPAANLPGQLIIAFVLAGMVAGSTASACAYQPAFRAFALPALAPIIIRFLANGERLHIAMGIMMGLFGIAMSRIAALGGETLIDAIRLRIKNEALVLSISQAQRRLQQANDELEERVAERTQQVTEGQWALQKAVIARDDFMNIASHELRAPLSNLTLHAQVRIKRLEKDPGAFTLSALRTMFEDDNRSIHRLLDLVDEMFDVSQLDSGTLTLNRESLELDSVVREVVDRFRPELEAAGSSIDVLVRSPAIGSWDKSRIEQVLSNLLSNALKYGAGKPIHCVIATENGRAILRLSDEGPGIAPDEQLRIFNKYERAASSQNVGGMGLGLYIARRIVEAHGGRISVESAPGEGATFLVELPLADHRTI